MNPFLDPERKRINEELRFTEALIASKLKALELSTNMLVDSIKIVDIDITNAEDTRQELARQVEIHLRRMPGSKWAGT